MIRMDALTLLKTRHSTRKFLQKPIEKEKFHQTVAKDSVTTQV